MTAAEDAGFPKNAIIKKHGDMSTYDWTSIMDQYVIPRIRIFEAEGIVPTIRGLFYFLTDSQIVAKVYSVYKGFDKALVVARKKTVGVVGYIAIGTFSDDTRRIIDIDDKYLTLEVQISRLMVRLTDLPEGFKDSIPRWLGQPNYVEIWIEKAAMTRTIYSIVKDRHVRIAPNRGWSSLEFLHKNMERLEDQLTKNKGEFEGIKDIWILYVGDFDPSGLKMDEHYEKELRKLEVKLGGHVHLHFKRIALTWDQITEFKLEHLKNATLSPDEAEKLRKDPNGLWFENQYGSRFQIQSDSLQTLQPAKFKKLILDEIDKLYVKKIRKKILSLPEHALPPEEIWEQIKGTWVYYVQRYERDREDESEDDDEG